MESYTEHYPLNTELTLRIGKANHKHQKTTPLALRVINLSLTKLDSEVIECHLTLLVNPEIYHRINTQALFNLHPQVRGSLSNGKFLPKLDIEIEISLQPNLLPPQLQQANNGAEAAEYILSLSQDAPDDLLLFTESWLALSVKQIQESGETGYSTIWSNITPANFTQVAAPSEEINEALLNFSSLPTDIFNSPTNNIAQSVEQITHAFTQLAETISEIAQKGIPDEVNEINDVAEDVSPTPSISTESANSEQPILSAMLNFFQTDDWNFTQVEGESVVQIPFQGENGQWTCYAKAIEERSQFVFYSIAPSLVPPAKRTAIAEFIARANYGMIIGNFELDLADGEIRYKTSIDAADENLSLAVIKKLVYANVTMMDRYLPGIKSVISGKMPPSEAIRLIEEIEISSLSSPSPDLIDNPNQSQNIVTESDIFCQLTKEEISKFEEVIQLQQNLKHNMAQSLIDRIKIGLKTRLGEDSEQLFFKAYTIFKTHQLDAIQIRFIGRYSELHDLIQLQIQQVLTQGGSDRTVKSGLKKWNKLEKTTKNRIQEIVVNGIYGQQETNLLEEITEIKEHLAVAKTEQKLTGNG